MFRPLTTLTNHIRHLPKPPPFGVLAIPTTLALRHWGDTRNRQLSEHYHLHRAVYYWNSCAWELMGGYSELHTRYPYYEEGEYTPACRDPDIFLGEDAWIGYPNTDKPLDVWQARFHHMRKQAPWRLLPTPTIKRLHDWYQNWEVELWEAYRMMEWVFRWNGQAWECFSEPDPLTVCPPGRYHPVVPANVASFYEAWVAGKPRKTLMGH